MPREQAEQRAAELNRDHPDRGAHRWFARQGEEGWEVARVTIPEECGSIRSRPRSSRSPGPRRPIRARCSSATSAARTPADSPYSNRAAGRADCSPVSRRSSRSIRARSGGCVASSRSSPTPTGSQLARAGRYVARGVGTGGICAHEQQPERDGADEARDRRAVADDRDVADDRRQAVGPVPEVVGRAQYVSAASAQRHRVVALGGVGGGDRRLQRVGIACGPRACRGECRRRRGGRGAGHDSRYGENDRHRASHRSRLATSLRLSTSAASAVYAREPT